MKEAAGEANMTVITIVLIGVVAAAGAVLLPKIFKGMDTKSCCTQSGGTWFQNDCYTSGSCEFNDKNQPTKCSTKFTPSCK